MGNTIDWPSDPVRIGLNELKIDLTNQTLSFLDKPSPKFRQAAQKIFKLRPIRSPMTQKP